MSQSLYLQPAAGTTLLAVTFSYITADNVQVIPRTQAQREAGEDFDVGNALAEGSGYTFLSAGQIQLTTPAGGTEDYLIRRATERPPLVTHQPGVFSSRKANLLSTQGSYIDEEQDNALAESLGRALRVPYGETVPIMPDLATRKGKYLGFSGVSGYPLALAGVGDELLRADLASLLAGAGATLVAADDGASGAQFTTLQGLVNKLRSAAGVNILPYGSDQAYSDGTIPNELVPRVTLAGLANVQAKANKVAFVHDTGKEGHWVCKAGAAPFTDNYNGLYKASATAGFYWKRIWDGRNAEAEWFGIQSGTGGGAAADLNNTIIYEALTLTASLGAILWLKAKDYWFSSVIRLDLPYMKLYGMGCLYTDTVDQATRIISTSDTDQVVELGPNSLPGGGISSFPQGIEFRDCYVTRSVAPSIASDCRGVLMRYVLYCMMVNIKSNGSMIGFEERGTVHSFKINCQAVRAGAGSGAGTDYFVGHYANGNFSIGAAGSNASLYNVDCTAGCNYGPLQSASGSIGFKADAGFTDVWYWNPETTNFYLAQGVFGNDATGLVFSNTDFLIDHPIHDQFTWAGIYVTDVATSGSVEIENPYYGPSTSARAAYYVNSSEGAVISRGGQFVMGGAPLVQAILLASGRGMDILDFPVILEHGNNYPVIGIGDLKDSRIEAFAKNPTVSAGAFIQLAGTCDALVIDSKCSGKALAFQYGIQVVGTGDTNCEYRVSGFPSSCLQAANRKLDRNGTPVTAIGLTGTNYAVGVFT